MSTTTVTFSSEPEPIPATVGRYEVLAPLGQGAMGNVYEAYDPFMKRKVAIKLLASRKALDEITLARFQREAEIVANLQHACIVPVFDFGQHEQQPYIVMQYMAAGSLVERIRQGALPLTELAQIVDRVAQALTIAHQKNIIHRDLKPANILFGESGDAYLADFGIAKIRDDFAEQLTGNLVLGTPEYMSPEQVRGQGGLDGRSDVYGLGVVFFQALTGQFPFRAATPIGTAVAHIMDPIPDVRGLRPNLPSEIQVLINRVLAKDPNKRYQTATEFANHLRLLADGRGYHLRLANL